MSRWRAHGIALLAWALLAIGGGYLMERQPSGFFDPGPQFTVMLMTFAFLLVAVPTTVAVAVPRRATAGHVVLVHVVATIALLVLKAVSGC